MGILEAANTYFTDHIDFSIWTGFSESDRTAALAQAQRQLAPYCTRTTAERYNYAVYEQALWLLQSRTDTRASLQKAGVTSFSLGNLSEQYDSKGRPSSIAPAAWSFLERHGVKVGKLK